MSGRRSPSPAGCSALAAWSWRCAPAARRPHPSPNEISPRRRSAAGLRERVEPVLADRAATEQVDDRQQQDRADEGRKQGAAVEAVAAEQGAVGAEEAAEQEAPEQRADDADDDVEQDALLRIGTHHDAREPADDAADNERKNETHR